VSPTPPTPPSETVPTERAPWARGFEHPIAFWFGALCCTAGVLLHLPMYYSARDMGYHLKGMAPDPAMIIGMVLIGVGLVAALYGVLPGDRAGLRRSVTGVRVQALDDAPIRRQHVALLAVMAVAVTIDVMKPTSLGFVVPGFAKEYGLKAPGNPHGHPAAAWLPLVGITGTVLGSLVWGSFADWAGRRAAIMYAGLLFVTTSICGAMPGFQWNLLMCLMMGIAAGGMLPITFALMAETIPARHRGGLMVLVGGEIALAYVITSWVAAKLVPHYSWRILWLIGIPTGLLLLVLNHWIPESPRYLIARGRRAEAEAIMARYGAREVRGSDTADAGLVVARAGYGTLVRRPFLGPTGAITVLGLGVGLVTYGFQLWVPTNLQRIGYSAVNSAYVVRNAALIGLPLTVLMAWLYDRFGGRKSIAASSAVTAAAMAGFVVGGDSLAHHRMLLSLLLIVPLSAVSSVVAMVAAYASEVYPTRIRARGTGLAAGMTKAGGVLILAVVVSEPNVPGIRTTALIGAIPLVIAAACFLISGPETRRRGLEDITRDLGAAGLELDAVAAADSV
jgi:putative MFS transporter